MKSDVEQHFPTLNGLNNFLTLPGEELIFAKRQHSLSLLLSLTGITVFLGIFFTFSFILESLLNLSYHLFINIELVVLIIVLNLLVKIIVDWYFHFYVITNRKIMEISYKPFYSKVISSVSLDQVRCIETNVKTKGILTTMLDIGDIVFNMDMLTHQSSFTISYVGVAHKEGVFLGDKLNSIIAIRSQSPSISSTPAYRENSNFTNLILSSPIHTVFPTSFAI